MSANESVNLHVLKPLSNSSPMRPTHASDVHTRASLVEAPVTITHLRADNLQRQAAEQQARVHQAAEMDYNQGKHLNSKSLKTGRDL